MNALQFGDLVAGLASAHGLVAEASGPQSLGFARYLVRDPEVRTQVAVKLNLAASSSFFLAPHEHTEEGILVSSYRDLCAGRLHAICDRFEPRDFVDLHAILTAPFGKAAPADTVAERARSLVADVVEIDPGLDPMRVGHALSRGLDRSLLDRFPLRLIHPVTDAQVQESIRIAVDACAAMTGGEVNSSSHRDDDPAASREANP